MPSMLPAMRGKFGSTEFFICQMTAKELTERLTIPKELGGWESMSIEERFQRDISYDRVKKHIAPYLSQDDDRFFGAFIVDIYNHDDVTFEVLTQMGVSMPGAYAAAGSNLGFLHLSGDEVLVPLDGQHRLTALKFAITGRDEKNKEIKDLSPNLDVARDTCTVILVRHDPIKARKIFNKVNRYAKPTSKGDNLITADDDIVAIISREIVADKILSERLVNYTSNTLSKTAVEFTTLSAIYETTGNFLEEEQGKKIDRTLLPPAAEVKIYRNEADEFWKTVTEKINIFQNALHDTSEAADDRRAELRRDNVLGKPIAQMALIDAIVRLHAPDPDTSVRISLDEVCNRVNALDWGVDESMWQRVLMNGEKVVTGKAAAKFAARFISYLLGEKLEPIVITQLSEHYESLFDSAGKKLPTPLF